MQADYISTQDSVISIALQSEDDKAALRRHVCEIVEGRAFRGSERSIRFLEFIVDKAIARDFGSLKERLIGIELFGRSPSYSTSKDAIVRVTASDVRKRLMQHYGWYGRSSKFQISLPPRTYIPEITAIHPDKFRLDNKGELFSPLSLVPSETSMAAVHPGGKQEEAVEIASVIPQNAPVPGPAFRQLLFYSGLAAILMVLFWLLGAHYVRTKIASAHTVSHVALPWPMLFGSTHPLQIITSDRGLVDVEGLVHKSITVSQYANHIYIPETGHLTPEVERSAHDILVSNRAAAVDIPIVVGITELAQTNSQKVAVRMAREIQMQDLNSDGNFVFLGSPRSNPWVSLFAGQMDFRFGNDANSNEFLEDVHPRPGDGNLPKQMRSSENQTYSVIAFLPNPNTHGSVLILSGLDIEGTQASGRLITDLPRMAAILRDCGVGENGASPYFELLLHPEIIAGSSTNTEVAACHRIQARLDSSH